MGKRVKIGLAVMAVALIGVIVRQVTQPPDEPVYKGKPLSNWLLPIKTGNPKALEDAKEAMRHAGTNALPALLRMLRVKDSLPKAALVWFNKKQNIINFRITSDVGWNLAGLQGFSLLGTNAQSAVPALIAILNQNTSRQSQSYTIGALSCIGPSAKEAVPTLLRFANDPDPVMRSTAAIVIRQIDPEAAAKAGIK
jgi:HEAT repeat protein